MSLLKQVSIVLGFIFFLILFVSIIGLSFNIIKIHRQNLCMKMYKIVLQVLVYQ